MNLNVTKNHNYMRIKLSYENFIERAFEIHGDKYDYSQVELRTTKDKVNIICPKHGLFNQSINNHLKGQNCPSCGQESRAITQRFSMDQFVSSAEAIHGKKYNYNQSVYHNSQTKVEIHCAIHGFFSMKPNSHVAGKQGCPKCGRLKANENLALDFSTFIRRANRIHGVKYEYLEDSYKNYTSKIEIRCKIHGLFKQTPHSHISMKSGCPSCGSIQRGEANQKSWYDVIDLFKAAHGDRYEYDENSYLNVTTKTNIKCCKHGWFKQTPYHHYGGSGCQKCAVEEVHEGQKIYFEEFERRAKEKHGDRYTYISDTFIDIFSPIEVTCSKHGSFLQRAVNHYKGAGCPKCSSSKGEALVRDILTRYKVNFEEQKTFPDLKFKSYLRCDFYLPNHNLVIEYNGIQHYEPLEVFGGKKAFEETINRDAFKRKYLVDSNISVLEIPYYLKDVESLILGELGI